jgi:TRAP-type C4-dicarboxylate transport system substrate-binding protein
MKPGTTRLALGLTGMIGFALTAGACADPTEDSAAASLAEMEDVTLSFQTQAPPGHPFGIAQQAFADEVTEETGGKVTIEPYFSGSLLAGDEDLSGLETGVADMGSLFATYHPQELPVTNWLTQMQSLRADTAPHGFLQASAALQKFVTTSEPIQQEFDEHNLVLLGGSSGATNVNLLCKEPVTSLEEAKGTRVRVGGPVWAAEVKAMGFTPVSLTSPEIYEAIERGVVDCDLSDPTTMAALSFWDVAKYFHPISASGASSTIMVVNRDTWDSLPEDVHEILRSAMDNYNGRVVEAGLEAYKNFADQADEKGVTFVDPQPLNESLQAYQDSYVADQLLDEAPPSVTDPDRFVQDWREALEWGMELAIENVGTEPEEPTTPADVQASYLSGPDNVDIPKFLADLRAGL